ncbi:MAG: tetratricopeptide repeat protein [Sneathiella sp.]|nr:tetratricopeptide repeat protein [Sneathiella sp.]
MGDRFFCRLKHGLVGSVALVALVGCSSVGAGNNPVNTNFLDEGGTSPAISDTISGQYLAGRQALRERDSRAAWEYFQKAYEADPEDDLLLQNTFQAALENGQLSDAIKLAAMIEQKNLSAIETARLLLAVEDIRLANYDSAIQRLNTLERDRFNIVLKPVLTAWALVGQGDFNAAKASLDTLDEYKGFYILKSYHLALLADAAGQVEVAKEAYETALKGPSGRAVRLIQSYGAFLAANGAQDDALKLFKNYQANFPLSPTILDLVATLEAGQELKPLINSPIQGAAEALYSSASIVSQQQINSLAITLAHLSLLLRPDLTPSHILLAEIAEDRRQYDQARDYYRLIPAKSPYAENAEIRIAWLSYRLGERDQAITKLENLIQKDPRNIEPLIVLADLSRDGKDWARAAKNYGKAIDNIGAAKGRLWSLHYARGISYERLGAWSKAEADLKKALELRPDNPQILNYLGYSWVDRNENLEEAKSLLIKAVSLRPEDGYIVDSLGWLYYRLNDFENAVQQLERAAELQPEDPTINDHLGDVYWQVGRYEEARYQWQRALWLEPEEDQIPIIKQKLKDGLPVGDSVK